MRIRKFNGFTRAKPIFTSGYDGEGNFQAGFTPGSLLFKNGDRVRVAVTAGTMYRTYVNGNIAAHGSARTAEGYLRADEIDISNYIIEGENHIAFEVVHYGAPYGKYSNDVSFIPPLLIAEICVVEPDGRQNAVAATSENWKSIVLNERIRIAERVSHCRQSAENYCIDHRYSKWRIDPTLCDAGTEIVDCPYTILTRGMALPDLTAEGGAVLTGFGKAELSREKNIDVDWFCNNSRDYFSRTMERPVLDYRRTEDLPAGEVSFMFHDSKALTVANIEPEGSVYVEYDFGRLLMGFISVGFETKKPCTVDIVHLESMNLFGRKDEVSGGANPVTRLHLPAGRTEFTCFEPALVRYLKIYVRPEGDYSEKEGVFCGKIGENTPEILIEAPKVVNYTTPDMLNGSFLCSNDDINRLYNAARRTLRLNTLDIFMDCPERERGGWLCDSLWTARAFRMMMGDADVEKSFIENFLLTEAKEMWHGFFPEVYPAFKPDYRECPGLLTWSFWLMIELPEYVRRTGDVQFALEHKGRIDAFVNGSLELMGESGLLENMPWIFIDWSLANDFCRPISTAANALWARMMIDLGQLYGEPAWVSAGRRVRSILREVLAGSDDNPRDTGGFLPDALDFRDGKLHRCGNYSEAAQYTIVWSGLFSKGEMPRYIWNLVHTTGASREFEADNKLGEAGLFIGLCIRLDMLSVLEEYEKLFEELQAIYMPQLREGPGTLWETLSPVNTSRCHGFSAHAGVHLTRDILGLGEPDEVNKSIRISPHPCGLRWAKGTVNTSDGLVSYSWHFDYEGHFSEYLSLPDGWKAV